MRGSKFGGSIVTAEEDAINTTEGIREKDAFINAEADEDRRH